MSQHIHVKAPIQGGGDGGPPPPPVNDKFVATRIVSLVAAEGTDLTIASAIAALPAEGGVIYLKQGTFPVAAGLIGTNKPIRIVGAGEGSIIDIGTNVITLFSTAFDQPFSMESLRVKGAGLAGQVFFAYTGAAARVAPLTFRDILVGNPDGVSNGFEVMFRSTLAVVNHVRIVDSQFVCTLSAASRFIDSAAPGGDWRVSRCNVTLNGGISGLPQLFAQDCDLSVGTNGAAVITQSTLIGCRLTGASTFQMLAQCRVSGCSFDDGTKLRFTGSRNLVVNSVFLSVIATHIETIGAQLSVIDCTFANFTSEAVSINGVTGCVVMGNQNCKVTESGVGVNDNLYSNNTGFNGSLIFGSRSIVTDWNTRQTALDITLDETHRTVDVDATAAARTITLPTAASGIYRTYTIKKIDATANIVTIDAAGAETIDGSLTVVLSTQYKSVTIQSNGTSWDIIAGGGVGTDLFAASRIVSLTPGDGTDLTIAAAIAALPAAGGDIYVKGGIYPIAATLAFGTKIVRLRGAGTTVGFADGVTKLVPAAGVTVFSGGGEGTSVEDIVIEGDNATSQILIDGATDIRFSRINVHDLAGICNDCEEVLFRDSYLEMPSGPGIPLADRYIWNRTTAGGTLIWDNVELFVTGGGATLMKSGISGSQQGPTFKVVNSYTGGGGGGGSTNFWFAEVIDWVGFDMDNAQFEISGARNNVVNCNFLDFEIKFKAIWNFISNCNFSQGGTGSGGTFDAQLTFAATFALPQQNTVTGCNFYGNGASVKGISFLGVIEAAVSGCLFSGHTTDAIEVAATATSSSQNIQITGCTFTSSTGGGTRYIDIASTPSLSFRVTVVGCTFDGARTPAIRNAGSRCVVADNVLCSVTEIGSANQNFYDNNTDFTPSGIIGGASVIDGTNVINTALSITLDDTHHTVTVDASGGARTITLPTAASAKWRKYIVKKTDASGNAVTVDAAGAETIDGALTKVLAAQYDFVEIQSNGATWWII